MSPSPNILQRLMSSIRLPRRKSRAYLAASRFFDSEFYLKNQAGTGDPTIDPIAHYLEHGAREGRQPHPLFDTRWYLATNPDVVRTGGNPLVHWVEWGRAELRSPHPLFDPVWYLAQNPDLPKGIDPLDHYLSLGAAEGRDPHPLFSTSRYLAANSDVRSADINPLLHYATHGQPEERPTFPAQSRRSAAQSRESVPSEAVLFHQTSRTRRPLVVLISHDCSLTGAPMVVLNLAEHLVAAGDVDVVVFAKESGELAGRFAKLPDFTILGPEPTERISHELASVADRQIKIAICNTVVTSDLIAPLRRSGFVVLSLIHEMPAVVEQVGGSARLRAIDAGADAIVFGSAFVRDAIQSAYGMKNKAMFVVPTGGTSPTRSAADVEAQRVALREEAGIPAQAHVVLGCGTIEHRKGVDLFVQVARLVRQSKSPADIRFVWIGAQLQPYFHFCKADVARFGLEAHVRFLDPRPDLFPAMVGADLFFLPSREDPFPLVSLAAMACGIPPIVFDKAGGAPDAVADGAGEVIPYLDLQAVAGAIVGLANDDSRRLAIGRRSLARFESRYSLPAFVSGLSATLEAVGLPSGLLSSDEAQNTARPRTDLGRSNQDVSIVIPSYNHAPYIEAAIRSVLEQDEQILELIIIDDCSTDGSDAIIRGITEEYSGPVVIHYERLAKNGGAHAAIMRGLSLARGDILSILNSDDYYSRDRFSTVLAEVPSSGDFLAFSAVDFVDETGARTAPDSDIRKWYSRSLSQTIECPTVGYALLRNNIAVTSGNIVFTRHLKQLVGDFAHYRMCHDWDFIMRATHYVEPIFVQKVRMAYRVHGTNTLRSTRHLVREEGVPALNTFVDLTRHEASPNRLAPSTKNWPIYFDYFIDTFACWFAQEPMRRYIRQAPPPPPQVTAEWRWDGRHPAHELGILTEARENQDALAIRREIAMMSRPSHDDGGGFREEIDTAPVVSASE